MNLSAPFIRRPVATALLMIGLLLAGVAAYPFLPVAPLPRVDFPTIQVSASLPGASPETMAATVAQPLERQFSQIAGVTQLTSTSALGSTQITVQFDLDRNIDGAAQDIQTAINAATGQLPKSLPSPPGYRKVNPADSPVLILGVRSDLLPITQVDEYADTMLAQQISQVPGVSQVSIGGEQKPAVRIQADPAKLAGLGLSLEDLRGVIVSATVNSAKGSINGPDRSFTLYDNDQITAAQPWNDVIIAYHNGAPVRIGDIGRAVDGPENTQLAAWQNGRPGVLLTVYKQPGANVIDTVDRIKQLLPQLQAAIPPAVHVDIMSDRTQTIRASVADVQFTLALTIALVVMVIFLFLRNAMATLIPGVTVPLSLAATLGLMYVCGYSLDNLSLMALTIAVGFVVDDAIVMVENIHRHIEEGVPPLQAALTGSREIGFTILSISLSLIAVFIPLLLMGGIVGRLFREFAVTVTMTIAVSALVSLTLTPMMGARLLKDERHRTHGRFYRAVEGGFDALLAGYRTTLDIVLRHQPVTLLVFAASVALTGWMFAEIPKGFFPQQDTGLIMGTSEGPQDASFAIMSRLQQQLGAVIGADPDVATWVGSVGAGSGQSVNTGRFFITLKPRNERTASADQVISRLRRQTAAVEGVRLYLQAAQDLRVGGRSSRALYQYTLQDADLEELDDWAPKVLDRLKTLPELRDLSSDQQTAATTATLTIDRDQAARFGIQPQLIDDTLYDAFGQRQVTQYFTQTNSYHVVLEVSPDLQGLPATLRQIYLRSPATGQPVPLSTLVKVSTRPIAALTMHAFIIVAPDNTVTVLAKHLDKGQGIVTGIATIAAEELDADWSQVRGAFAPADQKLYANHFFGIQGTGGSTAVANSWDELRMAGAAARAMLVAAASARWKVPAGEVTVSKGVVRHAASNRSLTFGELAEEAAKLPVPQQVKLKDPKDYVLIGNPDLHRLDHISKTNGTAIFSMDIRRPGQVTAVLARSPRFGGTVKSVDDAAARKVPGVIDVISLPVGVAVIARNSWAAMKGREALTVTWDDARPRPAAPTPCWP
ncbi:efflux RND transporter permease subunit, partial [Azospirillum sp. B506]|uniref:efflux RND transporter permease subunit n=1 Tax=Azospirillum sp. B506 TaxID=137721 RepID=UPI00067928AF